MRGLFGDPRDETALELPAIYQKTERPGGLPGHSRVIQRMGRPQLHLNLERDGLKADFRGDLESARPAAPQERIADADVAGSREAQCSKGPAIQSDAVLGRVRDKYREIRIGEIGV